MQEQEIHASHRNRMYERIQKTGFDGFSEHEVLEYLLFYVIPRADTNPIAHRLIERFGSFAQVLEADEKDLMQVQGIGTASARFLHSVLLAGRYYQVCKQKSIQRLPNSKSLIDYCVPLFFGVTMEQMYVVAMDDVLRVLGTRLIAEGSVNEVNAPIRKVAEYALQCGAAHIALAHNHPGGIAAPSREDVSATQAIVDALKPLNILVVDHIIVSGNEGISMLSTGRLSL